MRRGLEWLKRHQHADGHWSLEKFYNELPGKSYPGKGNVQSDTAATGFGLLPFLGEGHTPQQGEHHETVARRRPVAGGHQKPDGELFVRAGSETRMYGHGLASIALCEAYGMTQDPHSASRRRRRSTSSSRRNTDRPAAGADAPADRADTSVVGWQVMALKSGEMAGLDGAAQTFERGQALAGRVEANRPVGRACSAIRPPRRRRR